MTVVDTQQRDADTAAPQDDSLFAGWVLSGALVLLILVPIIQPSLVGSLRLVVPAAIAGGALVVWALKVLPHRGAQLTRRTTTAWWVVAYLAVMYATTYFAPDTDGPTQSRLQVLIAGSIGLLALMCSNRERLLVVRVVVVAAVLESAWAVYEAAANPGPLWGYANTSPQGLPTAFDSQIFDGAIRGQGTLGHPLVLAFLAVVAIGLTIGFRPLFRSRSTDIAVIVVLFAGVLASGSRSAVLLALALVLFSARNAVSRVFLGLCGLVLALIALTLSGFWDTPVVNRFVESDSLSHRASSIDSVESLLRQQDLTHILFGNGFWSTVRLYETSVLPNVGDFFAVDNQFVSSLACVGIVGLLALLGAVVVAWRRGPSATRWGLVAALGMWWTFEVVVWPPSFAITVALVVLAGPLRSEHDADQAVRDSTAAEMRAR